MISLTCFAGMAYPSVTHLALLDAKKNPRDESRQDKAKREALYALIPRTSLAFPFKRPGNGRWLLARRPENRVSLGRLWAIDGLVHALRSNARLDVKEG